MSLTMYLDTPVWREHQRAVARRTPGGLEGSSTGVVPVIKGNGYGFGLARLGLEASLLGADVVAVGVPEEVTEVRRGGWKRPVVVLTPWSPALAPNFVPFVDDHQVILTVGRLDDARALGRISPGRPVIIELLTSMQRFGIETEELAQVGEAVRDLVVVGWTIHLPMRAHDALEQARRLAVAATEQISAPIWVSHLSEQDYRTFAKEFADRGIATRLRLGTSLWLGAPKSRRVVATVQDMHPVRRGQRVGYWQRRMSRDGWVVVVSGGTSHGIALEAPSAAVTPKQRVRAMIQGLMNAAGRALSPFTIDGRKRMFVEPPHMQSSLVFLPGAGSVAIGDEVWVEVRLTIASVDRIIDAE